MKKVCLKFLLTVAVLLIFSGSAFAGDPTIEALLSPEGLIFWVALLFNMLIGLILVIAQWKLFVKAGQPGWATLVPIYNLIVMMEIAGKPGWWVLMMFIPFVNIIFSIMMTMALARNFGQSDGFGIGMILLPIVFFPILGFGDSKYSPVAPAAY